MCEKFSSNNAHIRKTRKKITLVNEYYNLFNANGPCNETENKNLL
jgi:hypothetical protein